VALRHSLAPDRSPRGVQGRAKKRARAARAFAFLKVEQRVGSSKLSELTKVPCTPFRQLVSLSSDRFVGVRLPLSAFGAWSVI
jgi:hypothetical protein